METNYCVNRTSPFGLAGYAGLLGDKAQMTIKQLVDTTEIFKAQQLYRSFWADVWKGMECRFPTEFVGHISDLEALSYCEYEVGYPESDYHYSSIIWGTVLTNNCPLSWGIDQCNNMVLYTFDHPYVCITPSSLIRDLQNSSDTQFDIFELATAIVIARLSYHDYYENDKPPGDLLEYVVESDLSLKHQAAYLIESFIKAIT